ncbi:MAG TPA: hypothetical protein V6D08_08585, partial [Candidatus Obscuribacterales bacterium]
MLIGPPARRCLLPLAILILSLVLGNQICRGASGSQRQREVGHSGQQRAAGRWLAAQTSSAQIAKGGATGL